MLKLLSTSLLAFGIAKLAIASYLDHPPPGFTPEEWGEIEEQLAEERAPAIRQIVSVPLSTHPKGSCPEAEEKKRLSGGDELLSHVRKIRMKCGVSIKVQYENGEYGWAKYKRQFLWWNKVSE